MVIAICLLMLHVNSNHFYALDEPTIKYLPFPASHKSLVEHHWRTVPRFWNQLSPNPAPPTSPTIKTCWGLGTGGKGPRFRHNSWPKVLFSLLFEFFFCKKIFLGRKIGERGKTAAEGFKRIKNENGERGYVSSWELAQGFRRKKSPFSSMVNKTYLKVSNQVKWEKTKLEQLVGGH